jgi:hypothetical protein
MKAKDGRAQFKLDILCPSCGAEGEARASENEDRQATLGPDFRVDEYPSEFSEAKRSAARYETEVKCKCGQVFCLL